MKSSGLGQRLYIGGNDISGDIMAADLSSPNKPIDVTDITQSAHSRLGGLRDGSWSLTSYFDPALEHPVLSALPTADVVATFVAVPPAIGGPAACMVAKQIDYNPSRSQAGELTIKTSLLANGFGVEWGNLLTTGFQTDVAAANGASWDTLVSASFGGQAYLHVASVVGTSVTVKIQDSADNSTFADVASFAFAAATPGGSPQSQRLQLGNTATLRRYLRAVTTGTFTSAVYSVVVVKNVVAGQTF